MSAVLVCVFLVPLGMTLLCIVLPRAVAEIATIVIAAWERELDREKLKVALSGHELRTDERPATPAC